jgi:hypothetical protein
VKTMEDLGGCQQVRGFHGVEHRAVCSGGDAPPAT